MGKTFYMHIYTVKLFFLEFLFDFLSFKISGLLSRLLLECIPGYFGPYCSNTCRYPTYGKGCQLHCFCDVSVCDYVQGCRRKGNA